MYGLMISHLHGEPPKTEHAGMRVLANSPAGQHDGLGEALLQAADGLCGELAELRGGQPVRQPQPLQEVDIHEGVHHHPERGLATGGWMMGGGASGAQPCRQRLPGTMPTPGGRSQNAGPQEA